MCVESTPPTYCVRSVSRIPDLCYLGRLVLERKEAKIKGMKNERFEMVKTNFTLRVICGDLRPNIQQRVYQEHKKAVKNQISGLKPRKSGEILTMSPMHQNPKSRKQERKSKAPKTNASQSSHEDKKSRV